MAKGTSAATEDQIEDSKAARTKISAAQKKRWAQVKEGVKK